MPSPESESPGTCYRGFWGTARAERHWWRPQHGAEDQRTRKFETKKTRSEKEEESKREYVLEINREGGFWYLALCLEHNWCSVNSYWLNDKRKEGIIVSNIARESRKRRVLKCPLDLAWKRLPLTLVGSVCVVERWRREAKVWWVDDQMETDQLLYKQSWLCFRNHISKTFCDIEKCSLYL